MKKSQLVIALIACFGLGLAIGTEWAKKKQLAEDRADKLGHRIDLFCYTYGMNNLDELNDFAGEDCYLTLQFKHSHAEIYSK